MTNLSDLCDLWITFNEPMVVVNEGFMSGITPPNIKSLPAALDAALQSDSRASPGHGDDSRNSAAQGSRSRSSASRRGPGEQLPDYEAEASPEIDLDEWAAQITDSVANWAFLRRRIERRIGLEDLPPPPNFFREADVESDRETFESQADLRAKSTGFDWSKASKFRRAIRRWIGSA